MDIINTQSLMPQEAYYHVFTKPFTYNWGFMIKQNYIIQVQPLPAGQANKQTIIQVTFQNGSFQIPANQTNITIYVGDSVSWEIPSNTPGTPGYSIVGDNGLATGAPNYDYFSNRSLGVFDAFSHLFWTPGTYQYNVSGGTGGVQQGSIPVSARPPAVPARPSPALVVLNDGNNPQPPKPDPVTYPAGTPNGTAVYTGDTVIWTIADGSKIVIQTQ